jgi:thiamine-phosphate pyrophosphorylase
MNRIKDNSLYLVITEEYGNGRSALEIAGAAIRGGVDIIQMREKNKPRAELVRLGKELSCLCKEKGVIFIVNDDPSIAKEVDADGVHLGQDDILRSPIDQTRELLGPDKMIGVSTESVSQVEAVNDEDIDYIAYGPVFCTTIKDKCAGTGDVERVLKTARKAVFFIGGITLSNIDELLGKGAKNISLIRGITESSDIASAAGSFKKKINESKKGRA